MPPRRPSFIQSAVLLAAVVLALGAGSAPRAVWFPLAAVEHAAMDNDPATPDPLQYHTFAIDLTALRSKLKLAGLEKADGGASAATEISLPMPDGRVERFRAIESPVLGETMQRMLPDVRTYLVWGLDDRSAYGRIDLTRFGLRAYIDGARGTVMIDPLVRGRTDRVMSYWTRDEASEGKESFDCGMRVRAEQLLRRAVTAIPQTRVGDTLRSYRFAFIGTAEYNAVYGGDTLNGLAELATAVNRINVPYGRDIAVRLVAVYLKTWENPDTDPFWFNGLSMVQDPQAVMDSLIGNGAYDTGAMLHKGESTNPLSYTGAGSVSSVGYPPYQMGTFLIGGSWTSSVGYRIMMHEIGHNFGCWHSYDGNCNRTPPFNFEPGSGSTIMARAGRCGASDIQSECDHYFHTWSQQEVVDWLAYVRPVGTHTPTGNTPPVAEAGPDYTIPRGTPFVLSGLGTDADVGGDPADTDTLRYCWEEMDQAPAIADSITGVLFRSTNPSLDPRHWYPEIANLLSGTGSPWNRLPNVNRLLHFRLTVRGVGPQSAGYAFDSMTVTVSGAPFLVTAPNGGGTYNRSSMLPVTWTVGGGDVAPTVNILFSEDGGLSWIPLVFATPNDGSQSVTLPDSGTITTCRIKVEAVGNIFYDVSNTNFTVTGTTVDAGPSASPAAFALWPPDPNPSKTGARVRFDLPRSVEVDLAVYSVQGQRVRTLAAHVWPAGHHTVIWNGEDGSGRHLRAGVYFLRMTAGDFRATRRVTMLK